eukprot:542332_1
MVSETTFIVFDILTIIISFADVITDIIVLYEWYINQHYGYFYASLSILLLANISYSIMFFMKLVKYTAHRHYSCNCCICSFCCLILPTLIFSFLLPYIIYFYESPHFFQDSTKQLKEYFGFNDNSNDDISQDLLDIIKSMDENFDDLKVQKILKKKQSSHIGFILETFLESFPQSIIQMIAILQISNSNNHIANIIIVTSIFLSLLSIAFKSIMLLAVSDVRTSISNWTAAVIDFFAVFVIVSWLFLEINGNENGITSTSNLQYFELCLFVITTIPFYATFLLYLFLTIIDIDSRIMCCCTYIIYIFVLNLCVVIGHIFCGIFIAFYVAKFGLFRFSSVGNPEDCSKMFRFIHNSDSNKDRLKKILIINHIIPYIAGPKKKDKKIDFKEWLTVNAENGFKNIESFKEWRQYIDRPLFFKQITFSEYGVATDDYEKMKKYLCVCIADRLQFVVSYVCLPLYLLGRVMHLLFPILVYFVNIGLYGINGVLLLHHVLNITFILLLLVILGISYKVLYFTYCIYHIGYWITPPQMATNTAKRIEDCYVDLIQLPIIIEFFDESFGEDVSRLILDYLKSIQLE